VAPIAICQAALCCRRFSIFFVPKGALCSVAPRHVENTTRTNCFFVTCLHVLSSFTPIFRWQINLSPDERNSELWASIFQCVNWMILDEDHSKEVSLQVVKTASKFRSLLELDERRYGDLFQLFDLVAPYLLQRFEWSGWLIVRNFVTGCCSEHRSFPADESYFLRLGVAPLEKPDEKRMKVSPAEVEGCVASAVLTIPEVVAVSTAKKTAIVSGHMQKREAKRKRVEEAVRAFVPIWKEQVLPKFFTGGYWALPGTSSGRTIKELNAEATAKIKELPALLGRATNIRVPGSRVRMVNFFSTDLSTEALSALKSGWWYRSSNFDLFYDILGFYMASAGINDVAVVQPSWPNERLFAGKFFLDYSKFLLPVCVNNDHWVLFFIDKQEGAIRFYDSLGTAPPEDQYIGRVTNKFRYFGLDISKYSVETVATFKQENSSDCGPFSVAFSFFLAAGMAFNPPFFKPPGNVRLFCTSILHATVLAYVTWSDQEKSNESGYEPEQETTTDAGVLSVATDPEGPDAVLGNVEDTGI
jgi:hypothetical protein